jgi:PAS domain S-box-containing protein
VWVTGVSETETQAARGAPGGAGALMRSPADDSVFQLFVESVREYAIFMLDPRGYVTTWNAGAERMKSWRADEIIGQHFSVFFPPEEVARGKPDYELEHAAREGRFEDEGWRVRKDGTQFWADVVITAIRTPAGQLVGFGKVTRDLTQRKKAEDERLALAAREEGVRVREELLVIAAHELRTPIAALQLHADLVRRAVDREGGPGEHLGARVRRLQHSATRLSRLVDAVLRVAALEPDKISLERRRLELRELVEGVIEDHAPDIASAGCSALLEPGAPVELDGDRGLLEVLVANLLTNALKYGARQPVSLQISSSAGRASVKVTDHGIGIDAERLPTLFTRFSRAVSPRHYGGLGLGLWTVRTIAEAHGGSVRATSEIGRGATFEVELPAAMPAAEAGVPR